VRSFERNHYIERPSPVNPGVQSVAVPSKRQGRPRQTEPLLFRAPDLAGGIGK